MAEPADLQAMIDTLRSTGAAERDPVRFAYLDALARRTAMQPEAVRRLLSAKLDADASELAAHRAAPPTEVSKECSASPLAELLAHIGQHTHEPLELKSVARFHETWSRLSAEQQLTQTLAQAPENAGPMNSQHLVLRSLQAMRDIAPDYLQGFMSYVDTLIWLENADPTKRAAGRSSWDEPERPKTSISAPHASAAPPSAHPRRRKRG